MKNWQEAENEWHNRLRRCFVFDTVMSILEEAGCRPPDRVHAAHADWGTTRGTIRVGLSYDGEGVHVMTSRDAAVFGFRKGCISIADLPNAAKTLAMVLKTYEPAPTAPTAEEDDAVFLSTPPQEIKR